MHYETRPPWPSTADGLGSSLELFDVEDFLDNDPATAWRASLSVGGSPGRIHKLGETGPVFRRGNCNGDVIVDLSDAVAVLFYLFTGGPVPGCLEGCDTDGSHTIAVNDAIVLLTYLFSVQGAQIPSPNPTECLPVPQGTSCDVPNCAG